jgi:1-deoxy-D-xylulose-5-phosphate reductoisomerase
VHSLVYYTDGSVLAQLGNPDMRTPIAYGLAWPARIDAGVQELDLVAISRLDFQAPDFARFPGLALGRQVAEARGAAPVLFNAANEEAVAAFLAGQAGFTEIPAIIDRVLQDMECQPPASLEEVLDIDRQARTLARKLLREA